MGAKTAGPRIAPNTEPKRTYAIPRARRSGGYMSPAAVRASSATPPAAPVSAMPVITTAVEPVRVASATSEQPSDAITKPTAITGTRPKWSIARPAGSAASPDDARKIAGPSPSSPEIPVICTNVIEFTAAASWKRHEFTASAAASKIVLRLTFRAHAASVARNSAAPPWDGWRTYGAPSARSARRPTASTRRPSATRSTNGSPAAISAAVGRRFEDATPGRCGCVGTRFQSSTSSAIPSSASVRCTIVALSSAGPVPVSCRSEVNAIPETLAPL